jgi:acyl-CoA synthetase (AMP-forming)/AMP-acid ligase II
VRNIEQLLIAAERKNPSATFGTFQQHDRLDRVLERAREVAQGLRATGVGRGDVVALIGNNRAAYIVTWMAAQMLGAQTALVNPSYPDEFLGEMLDDLRPRALAWIARSPGHLGDRQLLQVDASMAWEGKVSQLRDAGGPEPSRRSTEDVDYHEIAAYVHTSGTTGRPKFCALSHGYFIRLGRYFADTMSLSRHDVVVNPLPMFHINPIGNGVVGSLTGCAAFLSTDKFVVSEFWPEVIRHGATALILHGPPASMLKAKTTWEHARGHRVRIGFYCDPAFLEQFDVPIGVGGYGSTEAGGYCHSWKFRADDADLPPEGPTHLSANRAMTWNGDWQMTAKFSLAAKALRCCFPGISKRARSTLTSTRTVGFTQATGDGWMATAT